MRRLVTSLQTRRHGHDSVVPRRPRLSKSQNAKISKSRTFMNTCPSSVSMFWFGQTATACRALEVVVGVLDFEERPRLTQCLEEGRCGGS